MTPLLDIAGIGKRFGSTWVLRDVDFTLAPGEVHALIGENGAGKSTLIKLIAGVHAPDQGTMIGPDGTRLYLHSPRDALMAGIGVVHQELDLFDNLTVAENMALGPQRSGPWRPAAARLHVRAAAALARLRVTINPAARVGSLSTSAKQLVTVAKVLDWQARILIFDEPTSALNGEDAAALQAMIRALRAAGIGIIYVSHKLAEIFSIADRATVLRDGRVVGTWPTHELSHDRIVHAMLGQLPSDIFPAVAPPSTGTPFCRAVEMHGPQLRGASLSLRRGEVVALAGLPDAGASAVLRSLFGLDRLTSGRIELDGAPFLHPSPSRAIERGLAYLPADRLRDGLLPLMSVLRNVEAVAEVQQLLSPALRHQGATEAIRRLAVRAASIFQRITALSGGNQQKALLARWLLVRPTLLLLDDPTRGVDIGAKVEIYSLLREIARAGTTVAYTSSETLELAQLADRILLFRDGRVVEEIVGRMDHEALDQRIEAT